MADKLTRVKALLSLEWFFQTSRLSVVFGPDRAGLEQFRTKVAWTLTDL